MEKYEFSSRLKTTREKSGLSQKEFAAKLGITYTKYNHYETGRNQPDIETIIQIADFFDITTDYLLGRNNPTKKEVNLPSKKEKILDELSNLTDEELLEMEQIANYIKSKKTKNQNAATIETTA